MQRKTNINQRQKKATKIEPTLVQQFRPHR